MEEKQGGEGGRTEPIHLRLLRVKVSLFQRATALTHTLLFEPSAVKQRQLRVNVCEGVFALAGYRLRTNSRCIPLEQGPFLQIHISSLGLALTRGFRVKGIIQGNTILKQDDNVA